jgi:hypothetical protein
VWVGILWDRSVWLLLQNEERGNVDKQGWRLMLWHRPAENKNQLICHNTLKNTSQRVNQKSLFKIANMVVPLGTIVE